MRTIKFRGKRTDNGEWVYGDLFQCKLTTHIFPHDSENENTVIKETVGQFTGLFDKDGKEIYEHDILSAPFDETATVIYQPGYFTCNGIMGVDELSQPEMQHKVIGNIHDKTSDQ